MKPMYRHAMKVLVWQLLIILIPLLALAIPGRLLDKELGTSPRYLIIGIIIALGITVTLSFILVKKWTARLDNIARNSKPKDKNNQNNNKPAPNQNEANGSEEDKSTLI
ncbi:hypothetical protein ACFL2B_01180 [Patescibacteria group bacterium]